MAQSAHLRFVFTCLILIMSMALPAKAIDDLVPEPQSDLLDNPNLIIEHQLSLTEVERISGELRYIDEVLTSSVLSYAFSGDDKWLTRYQDYEPKLGLIINQLLASQSTDDQQLISRLEQTNNQLVSIEIEAINLVKDGRRQDAMALINGDVYHDLKTDYLTIMSAFIERIKARAQQQAKEVATQSSLALSAQERSWIAHNTVKVGVEYWPPIIFLDKHQNISGLSGEILEQIIEKTGLKVEYISAPWEDLLSQFYAGNIDLLPDAYINDERKQYGQFSKPYFLVREHFYVKDSDTKFQNNSDLTHATIAIVESYATVNKINQLYPNINIVETKNIQESVKLVLSGKADALVDAKVVVTDWVNKNNIDGLREIEENVLYPASLHFLSNNQHPLLHSIIEKSLDSLKISDLMLTNNDWLNAEASNVKHQQDEQLSKAMWFVISILLVLMLLGTIISSIVLRANDSSLAAKFSSSTFRHGVFGGLITLSTVLIVASIVFTRYAEQQTYDSLEYNLNTLLTTTHQRLSTWSEYEINHLAKMGKNNKLSDLVEQLINVPRTPDSLRASPIQSQIRQFIKANESDFGKIGFFIITPDLVSLASSRDANIGTTNIISQQHSDLLSRVLAGETVFIPPLRSDVHLTQDSAAQDKEKPPTMFFAVPVFNRQDRIIAILTKRVDFEGIFSSILSAGFIGKSGETYAIDKSGILLSNVRFEDDLKTIGLLDENLNASLNVRIADPGYDLTKSQDKVSPDENWPLTYMARQVIQQRSGSNLVGYNDYRGVKVIGSWLWDDSLNIGIAAEVDHEESLSLVTTLKWTVYSVLFISLLLIFGSTMFTLKVGTRATKALARSHAELEREVKNRTQELQINVMRTRSIIDNASDGIIVINEQGEINEFSPAAEHIFGYDSSEVIGTNIDKLMNMAFHREFIKSQQAGIDNEGILELIGICKNRNLIDIEVAVSKAIIDDEAIFTGIVRNTTLRKEAERELKKAKQKAEEATQAKSDFLANMSHEIRTPMNAIIGMSYLALQTELNKKQLDYVNKIHSSAENLLGIINDILDFSKIEAGKLELEETYFNLNDTIEHLVQIISIKSQQKEIELLIDVDPQMPIDLIGDALRLGQILINLANNSIKFTTEGEIIIRAKALEQNDHNVIIQFSVQDTGIGMTQETLGRLFQSFSQADASTTRKYGGTGLGLTISKTLTEMMNGKIWVESSYGEGSTFYFTARFGIAKNTTPRQLASSESLANLPVLIVDDSLAAREILTTLTQSLGFAPTAVESGEQALQSIIEQEQAQNPYKLVLADWKMPLMDGVALRIAMQEHDDIKQIPKYVMVTAYDRDDMLKKAKVTSIDGSITKPVSASTLLETVMHVIGATQTTEIKHHSNRLDFSEAKQIAGAKLLLVEDNEINQQIAVELLSMAGLQVETAWHGEEALTKLQEQPFDIVLMDVQMPIMDGYTATREIRKLPQFKDLPIIAMTANAMAGDKERCLEAGMNDHLPKPIDPKLVFQTLAQWLLPHYSPSKDLDIPSLSFSDDESFELEGFDTKSALSRMGGNLTAYKKTLKIASSSQADVIDKVKSALSEQDLGTAILVIHTLKGVAANIGADFIVPVASELEQKLNELNESENKNITPDIWELMEKCQSLHQQMIATISQSITAEAQSATAQRFDTKKVNEIIEQLSEQVECYDGAATDTCDELLTYFDNTNLSDVAQKLSNAVSVYDFDIALERLTKLKEALAQSDLGACQSSILNKQVLLEKLTEISTQIEEYDSAVVESLAALAEYEFEQTFTEQLTQLCGYADQYDFEQCEQLINQLIEQVNSR